MFMAPTLENRQTLPMISGDWAIGEYRATVKDDTKPICFKRPFDALDWADANGGPAAYPFIGLEASSISYPSGGALKHQDAKKAARDERDAFIRECAKRGYTLIVYHTRMTDRFRRIWFPELSDLDKKDPKNAQAFDDADDVVIRRILREKYVYQPKVSDEMDMDIRAKRERAKTALIALRTDKDKQELSTYVIAHAGIALIKEPYRKKFGELPIMLDEAAWMWGGDDRKWNLTSLATVIVAAAFADSVREFDFIIGFNNNAYESVFRSDILFHRWRHLVGLAKKDTFVYDANEYREQRRIFQRELRRMYRLLREADVVKLFHDFSNGATRIGTITEAYEFQLAKAA